MPLAMVRPGQSANIKRVTGKEEVKRHLENLGFVEGQSVSVVSELSGNLIINVKGSRVALDKNMASRIIM
ncbi:MAG: ferrous iron transport protein A [Clostridiales bacterium]|nr:ferrous iron transport protein A [Clostridiales bacterium]